MMTFFKEAFQVNRKSYPERVRSALFHAIKKTAVSDGAVAVHYAEEYLAENR
jgi:hypothetical protein